MVGFRIQHCESLNPEYICPKCSLLLRNAVQFLDCGHRQCQSCIDEQQQQQQDTIMCYRCHKRIHRDQYRIDRGFHNDMQTLNITCAFCNWTGILKNYENHLNQIHSNPQCPHCHEKLLSIDDLNRHLQSTCEKILIPCPLHSLGCNSQISPKDLSKHFTTIQHQEVLMKCVNQLRKIELPPRSSYTSKQLEEIQTGVEMLNNTSNTLQADLQRVRREYIHHDHLLQLVLRDLPLLRKLMNDQNNSIAILNAMEQPIAQEILLSKQRLKDNYSKAIDGTFIWRIEDVQEKILAARSGEQPSIDSPPFYSSSTGYKMCIRLFLNGDQSARGRFLSLNFILMRGDFDAILDYPFCFPVIFCLVDQSNQCKHRIYKLIPDFLSKNYQRPQIDMVVASEILEFVPLQIIHEENNPFIHENTMFIRIAINFNQIPDPMMSFVMNVNPALNNTIQQMMIDQERGKYRQV